MGDRGPEGLQKKCRFAVPGSPPRVGIPHGKRAFSDTLHGNALWPPAPGTWDLGDSTADKPPQPYR